MSNNIRLKFIDLFSGIGGFHKALETVNGIDPECVFASEINQNAIDVYEENFDIEVAGDVTKIDYNEIPSADLLTAGFPCQTFSKAGNQEGFNDKTRGTLFFHIKSILKHFIDNDKPIKYILLENVRNLASHNGGDTWITIRESLRDLGYLIHDYPLVMSPTDLEPQVPQSRDRVFIYGIHASYNLELPNIEFTEKNKNDAILFKSNILDEKVNDKYFLKNQKLNYINMWQELLDHLDFKPSFAIWGNYFKYDIESNPESCKEWKLRIIARNQDFYHEHKIFIDDWAMRYDFWNLKPSFQKFEWQCQDNYNYLNETIMQFRPSGLRAKKPTFVPSLVAINHIPIIYQNNNYRYMTPRECARLQSFPDDFILDKQDSQAYKQLGNSVNVRVVNYILNRLLGVEINENR